MSTRHSITSRVLHQLGRAILAASRHMHVPVGDPIEMINQMNRPVPRTARAPGRCADC